MQVKIKLVFQKKLIGGHFEMEWLPIPTGAIIVMAQYPDLFIYFSTNIPNLVLLSQNAQLL